uniref:Uncharacterized protein n=1 Tax=Salix viminalis TaxID=40686 RepID=A0A6N2KBQ7_SALVM
MDIFYMLHIIFSYRPGRGDLVDDKWAIAKSFLIGILSVLPLPQVIGAFWYLFSIERQTNCWRQACGTQDTCRREYLFCDGAGGAGNLSFLDNRCPIRTPNETVFNFGIFLDALQSGVVLSSTGFSDKFFYCFWWGMRNLSSFGQNLKTSTMLETCFAVFISISGLVLLAVVTNTLQMQKQLRAVLQLRPEGIR